MDTWEVILYLMRKIRSFDDRAALILSHLDRRRSKVIHYQYPPSDDVVSIHVYHREVKEESKRKQWDPLGIESCFAKKEDFY